MKTAYREPYIPENLRDQDWKAIYDKRFYINDIEVVLPDDIYRSVELENCLLVLISPRCDIRDKTIFDINRNIWCFNEEGEKVWEVEDRLVSMQCTGYEVDPYIGMGIKEEGIMVRTFGGFYGYLDIKTGKVANWKWSR